MISKYFSTIDSNYTHAIQNSLDDMMNSEEIGKNSRVVVLVDFSAGHRSLESGVMVDPNLIFKIVSKINKKFHPKNIYIGGSENNFDLNDLFKRLGYYSYAKVNKNVAIVNFSKTEEVKYLNESKESILKIASIPELLALSDYVVLFSTLKRNVYEKYSGCTYSLADFLINPTFKEDALAFSKDTIYDLYEYAKPGLSILDARYSLESLGPIQGDVKKTNFVLMGTNPLIVDKHACNIIGQKVEKVTHLKKLIKKYELPIIENSSFVTLKNIKGIEYFLFRVSRLFKKIKLYMRNISTLFYLGTLAIVSIGGRDLLAGKWMSFSGYYKIIKTILFKLEEDGNLLEWKITINKHVKEETLS
ncbi:DUF362 domain-containing protein [Methylophilaceae bacterium Uisw_099_01]